MSRLLLAAVLCLVSSHGALADTAIGFQHIGITDPSRFSIDEASVVEVSIWYPARPGSGTTMTFGDLLAGADEHFFEVAGRMGLELDTETRSRVLGAPIGSRSRAEPAAGRFPLVIYASAATESNHRLAEHLAGRGYVVASVSNGPGNVPTRGGTNLAVFRRQAHEMALLLGRLRELPYVDPERQALIGFSTSGGSAVFLASHRPDIEAVVSIEGWDAFTGGTRELRRRGGLDPRDLRSAVLHVSGGTADRETQIDRALVEDLVFTPRWWLEADALDHQGFLTYASLAGPREAEVEDSVHAVHEAIASFLDEHVRGAGSLVATAREHETVLELRSFPDPPRLPTSQTLWDALWEGEVDGVREALRGGPQGSPLLTEDELNRMASMLAHRGRLDDALEVGRLQTEIFPGSFAAWHTLGDLHRLAENSGAALAAYRRALELHPHQRFAASRYRDLAPEGDTFGASLPAFGRDQPVVLDHPDTAAVTVRTDLAFGGKGEEPLRFDLYSPPGIDPNEPRPLVLFANGTESREARRWGAYTSWPRLVAAALGVRAVSHEGGDPPRQTLADLHHYLRANAAELGIDPERIAVWSCSANVRATLPWLMEDRPPGVVAASLYYGVMDAPRLRSDLPLQVVRAGRDQEMINRTIDAFVERALAADLPLELLSVAGVDHAFDIFEPTANSRRTIAQTLEFLRRELRGSE